MSILGRPTVPEHGEIEALRERLQQTSLSVGIPAYNEGPGIVHTLRSVVEGIVTLGLPGVTIILSDSSDTTATVDAARSWMQDKDVQFVVDRSERRRSSKEARNVLMARASSDLLVQVDADVIVPSASLYHLLRCLTDTPAPVVAIGAGSPDPKVRGRAFRASVWQLNATQRYASWLPDDAVRAEAACWGAWRSFYSEYRFPVGAGSPVDDVCLAQYLTERNVSVRNCWRAGVYKIPAGTLKDFFLQTHRGYAASGTAVKGLKEIAAAVVEAAKDPVGAGYYIRARFWSAREQRRQSAEWREEWEVTQSTKRL
jgi:glycosyltransferase involved in cell wall biosynthesis